MFIVLFNCQGNFQTNEVCSKYKNEVYLDENLNTKNDSTLLAAHDWMLNKFEEESIEGLKHEVYQLFYYSSFGHGKSIKFEKNGRDALLTVKCYNKDEGISECIDYIVEIERKEWDEFENMIYEFHYWTSEKFRANLDVLDGYGYLLSGNRPSAEICKKRIYSTVFRGSPRFDRIGSLCRNIQGFEEHLKFQYEQSNKLNRRVDTKRLLQEKFNYE